MEVLSKLKPRMGRKNSNPDPPPSKDDILSVMENYNTDKGVANKENNNNSDHMTQRPSLEDKWEMVDPDLQSAPASLSHSYSLEWERLFTSGDMIKSLKDRATAGELRSSRFRSVVWKLFLEVITPDMSQWIEKTRKSRNKFEELKNRLIVNPRKAVDTPNLTVNNPLSQDEESPWNKFFQDNELRLTIKQDVIRTFPEVEFFRGPEMGDMMIDILFCYSREHATSSYKQGMHELLAPLIFVLHCDHQAFLHACEIESVLCCKENVMKEVMDPAYLEHDAYAMFCQVMETVEPWYLSREYCTFRNGSLRGLEMINATPFSRSQDLNPSNVIVTKLTRIQDYVLKKFDLELHQHLERLEIAPQIYGIRWLRLLFGREFPMQDLLMLWDAIFADGIGFDLVDYVFVAMLLFIRDLLLTSDYATCLTILMKYPPVADVQYFVLKAMWLREPNQHPRPPNYTHQGTVRSSNISGSSDNIYGTGQGAGKSPPQSPTTTPTITAAAGGPQQQPQHHRGPTQHNHKRQSNMMGGFSSFSRKFSRPRTLSVPKSSSEPMNLQTDISPDQGNDPIGSTVSLSQVEESMMHHTSSSAGLARLEHSNMRSAQSSPGVHHSNVFPLTPDDSSVTSSPTKYNTLPGKSKAKQKKVSQRERELQEKVAQLQGELNDKASMCRYCASKLGIHISSLQQEMSKKDLDSEDDVMLALAGLKLVRDVLNGTLKFTQTFGDEEEIEINDDYYGSPDGIDGGVRGDERSNGYSTGVTSPESDILLGADSDYRGSGRTQSSSRSDGAALRELNDGELMGEAVGKISTPLGFYENQGKLEREHIFGRDGVATSGSASGSAPSQVSSRIRSMFRSSDMMEKSKEKLLVSASSSTSMPPPLGVPGYADSSRMKTSDKLSQASTRLNQESSSRPAIAQRKKRMDCDGEQELTYLDNRRRTKSNADMGSLAYWPDFGNPGMERRHSDYRGEMRDTSREGASERGDDQARGRSRSQPLTSMFCSLDGEQAGGVNPLYKLHYQEMEY